MRRIYWQYIISDMAAMAALDITLFSHFIPCDGHKAIYFLDGVLNMNRGHTTTYSSYFSLQRVGRLETSILALIFRVSLRLVGFVKLSPFPNSSVACPC